jgi:hypothetical protein
MFLDKFRLETTSRRDGRDLPGVVALHAADGNEGVTVLGQRVRQQVL